jgi:hypothetical protein
MPAAIATSTMAPTRGRLSRALWRVRQFGHALWSRSDPSVDAELRRLLDSESQWRLLARLTPFDRAHHLRVYQLLIDSGQTDPDLLLAGLLHDVGKADNRGRVNATHRAAHVLLRRLSPSQYERLAVEGCWFRHGLWLNIFHAELGAKFASEAGASERCCALIRAHADLGPQIDPLLAALVAADNASIR